MGGLQRIRGQEVSVQVMDGSTPKMSLSDVRSFEVTPKFTKLEEKYLGETSNRYDDMFDGLDFNMEVHIEDAGVVDFIQLMKTRAQSRVKTVTINIQATLKFATGTEKTIRLLDCYFENMPLTVGGRSEYVTYKLSGSCSDFTTI